jgi:L-alanine-DL-glutamate epimerase-like enolase superfamily enzyme
MKINQVEAITVSIPLEKPLAFSTRKVSHRHYTIVRIRTDQGIDGWGYCYGGNRAGQLVTAFVRDFYRDHLLGSDPRAVEDLWSRMYRDAVLVGRKGAAVRALSAIDIALWDIKSKAAGLPLYRALGGGEVETVPCYASGGYYWPDKHPDTVADEVAEYVEAGFTAVKIKVGQPDHHGEVRRALKAREAIGTETILMMDANNAWPDAATAIYAIRALEEADPFWVEEPLMPDDVAGHAKVRASVGVPIATGEIEATRWGFAALLDHDAVDMIQPDATVLGGITEFRRVLALAETKSVPAYPHWMHHIHVSMVAAYRSATMVEYFWDRSVLNMDEIVRNPITAKAGQLSVPQDPGIGIDFDEAAIVRLAVDKWS